MSVVWGPGWYVFCDEKIVHEENQEQMYVDDMIANSADERVRNYYSSNEGGQVYVKAGRHTSASEPAGRHITLQLGLDKKPFSNQLWPAFTAHVIDLLDPNSKFMTRVFAGFTNDSKKKIENL